jgi:hypothetical protein
MLRVQNRSLLVVACIRCFVPFRFVSFRLGTWKAGLTAWIAWFMRTLSNWPLPRALRDLWRANKTLWKQFDVERNSHPQDVTPPMVS